MEVEPGVGKPCQRGDGRAAGAVERGEKGALGAELGLRRFVADRSEERGEALAKRCELLLDGAATRVEEAIGRTDNSSDS